MGLIELESEEHAIHTVATESSVLPVGARTKPHLCRLESEVCLLDCRQLTGVTEYEPTEFTFTARAGTRIAEINQLLSQNGQYLPFDAPYSECGSTLGGSIAAGINGSSSLRFGGARDFILGIQFIDGRGKRVSAGGKVVKNAAGFDLPKFFVGSYGRFGMLTELTLKVFPQPEAFSTLIFEGKISELVGMIKKLILSPLELDAVDIMDSQLFLRIGGPEESISTGKKRIQSMLNQSPSEILVTESDQAFWRACNQFLWHAPQSHVLVKVPCQINDLGPLFEIGNSVGAQTRAALAGQVVYFSVPEVEVANLVGKLNSGSYPLQTFAGPDNGAPFEGSTPFGALSRKVKTALDPDNKFLTLNQRT